MEIKVKVITVNIYQEFLECDMWHEVLENKSENWLTTPKTDLILVTSSFQPVWGGYVTRRLISLTWSLVWLPMDCPASFERE